MTKLKYIFIFIVIFASTARVKALDIQYGSIKGYKGNDVLIEYYGIDKKTNYLCNISNYKCSSTKKTMLGNTNTPIFKNSVKKELSDNKGNHAIISKEGQWLAYLIPSREPEKKRSYIIKNLKDNKKYSLKVDVDYWDLINEQKKIFDFSPDEKTLVYLDDKDDSMSLYKVDTLSLNETSINSTKINTLSYNISYFMFIDSQNILYVGNTKENPYKWSLYNLDLNTGKDSVVDTDVSYLDKMVRIGNSIVYIRQEEKGYGPAVYNIKTKKINSFKVPKIVSKKNIKNEEFVDLGNLNAVIMKPANYDSKKMYPVLIWLHGGPLRQTSYGYHPYHSYGIYDGILKLLQKNDVIVMKLDYRGSFGFSREYAESIKGSVGLGDIDDVIKAVKYAKAQYNTGNVYLAGNSYGGYMSLRAIVEYSETFKGVFSINGVTNWESLLVKMRTSIFNTQFYGLPNDENRGLYDQASIIDRVKNLGNQRIEIIHGEADRTIPLWQAIELTTELKKANKNYNLVTYKAEDHVFKGKKNIGDMCVRLFKFVGVAVDKECSK